MTRNYIFTLFAIISILFFNSCEKEVDESEADELLRLQAYMSIYYPDLVPTESGLYYKIEELGTGPIPSEGDYILFEYTGRNLDDYVFETTSKSTAYLYSIYSPSYHYAPKLHEYLNTTVPLIKGLKEGFSLINEGTKARFIMPSSLAYGSSRYRGLYPYSSIIFDIELKRVISDPEAYEMELITNYVSENYSDLVLDDIMADSIYILENIVDEVGVDEEVPEQINEDDVVKVYYTGRFVDNWVFDTNNEDVARENDIYDSSRNYEALEVRVGGEGFIEGFSLALKNLYTKSTAKVIIPSRFAYGVNGSESIPPYAPLIFELRIEEKTSESDDGTGK